MKTRVRYAPSPTGDPHIGNIRVALFNWLFARKNGGDFIIRIEDTDSKRKVPGSVERILESLKWLGLNYDEGPYYQSERLDIYKKYVQELIDKDYAYYCFCTSEELEKERERQIKAKLPPMYNRRCRDLDKKEVEKKLKDKTPYVIRLKVPTEGKIKFKDAIKGEIEFDFKSVDDQVLLKSDGYPTYHLASVVDDYLMKITQVIRGEEWISSVPKHLLLYKFFGWTPPKFAHVPLILGPNKEKLSKREGAIPILEYEELGYIPDALINFMALLGWNPDTEQEVFSREELIKKFSLEKIQKTNAVFDIKKLDWINGLYIRNTSLDELTKKAVPYFEKAGFDISDFDYLKKIISAEKERIKKLSEIRELADFFFTDDIKYDPKLLFWKKQNEKDVAKNLTLAKEKLFLLSENDWNKINLEKSLMDLAKATGVGELLWPLRVSLTGKKGSPSPFEVAEILGREKTIKRIEETLKKL